MVDDTLIFLHIAKAGGSTFEKILEQYYAPEVTYGMDPWDSVAAVERLRATPKEALGHVRLLKGHMPFGLHECLPGRARYGTFLRHPVERVLSMDYFILRTPGHYLYEAATQPGMDLARLVSEPFSPELDNGQVKAICGNYTHYGCCTRGDLARAKANIREWFPVVGLVERYDESLLLMKRKLGWEGHPYYRRENVTEGRPERAGVSAETIAAIEAANALDMELYRWAERRLRWQLFWAGRGLRAEVKRFQEENGRRMV